MKNTSFLIRLAFFAGALTLPNAAVAASYWYNGDNISVPSNIVTAGNDVVYEGLYTVQNQTQFEYRSGSSGALIAGQQVKLKPGFHAFNGSDLWAFIDANFNGISDYVESVDADGDGYHDALEQLLGTSTTSNSTGYSIDVNGDGLLDIIEDVAHGGTPSSYIPSYFSGYQNKMTSYYTAWGYYYSTYVSYGGGSVGGYFGGFDVYFDLNFGITYTYFDLLGWQYSTEFYAESGSEYVLYAYTPGSGWTALTNIISGDDTWFEIFSPLFDYIWQIPQFVRLVEVGQPLGGAQITDEQGNVLADVTVAPGGTVNATVTIPVGSQKITVTVKDVLGKILSGEIPVEITVNGGPITISGSVDILNPGNSFTIGFGWGDGTTTTINFDNTSIGNPLLWETSNPSNQIFNPTPKDDPWGNGGYSGNENGARRNELYLVPNPSNNLYQATLQMDIQPTALRTEFRAAAYYGETKVPGSDTAFNSQSVAALEFAHPGAASPVTSFSLWVGHDDNANGVLDSNERGNVFVVDPATGESVGHLMIRGTSPTQYNTYKGLIDQALDGTFGSIYNFFFPRPHARAFLRIFRDGTLGQVPPDKSPTSQVTVSLDAFGGYFSEWLTHNSGASFNANGVANITEYIWDNTGGGGPTISLCDLVADSSLIKNAVTSYYNTSVASQVASHFSGLPVGSEADFPSSTGWYQIPHTHLSAQQGRPWVPPTTVDFFAVADDDVGNTLGRSRILSHRARYHVKKQTGGLVVTQVLTDGEAIDLYDFNHEIPGTLNATQAAATFQIGYGNGAYGAARDRGKIYRNRIKYTKTYSGLP